MEMLIKENEKFSKMLKKAIATGAVAVIVGGGAMVPVYASIDQATLTDPCDATNNHTNYHLLLQTEAIRSKTADYPADLKVFDDVLARDSIVRSEEVASKAFKDIRADVAADGSYSLMPNGR